MICYLFTYLFIHTHSLIHLLTYFTNCLYLCIVSVESDETPKKEPAKVKELEDKFNGKILENGVR